MKFVATTLGSVVLLGLGASAGCSVNAVGNGGVRTPTSLECKVGGPSCIQTPLVTTSTFLWWNTCRVTYDYQRTKVAPGLDVSWVLPSPSNGVGRLTFDASGVVIGNKVGGVMKSNPSPDFVNGRLATTTTQDDTYVWTASPAGYDGKDRDYAFQAVWIRDEASIDRPILCTPKIDPVIVNSL